jgi:hypothetical protein
LLWRLLLLAFAAFNSVILSEANAQATLMKKTNGEDGHENVHSSIRVATPLDSAQLTFKLIFRIRLAGA